MSLDSKVSTQSSLLSKRALGALALASLALGGCAIDAGKGTTDEGDEIGGARPSSAPIIGGARASAYQEAALIDMYAGGVLDAACSGSLIAPQVVLTAGHCVDGSDGWDVTLPYAGNVKVHSTSAATYDWKENGATNVNPSHHDLGLIFLPKPLKLTQYPVLATAALANGSKIVNVGRIDNGTLSRTDLYAGPSTSISDASAVGYAFDYYSTDVIESGDSGGPDILAGSSPHKIVAVNSGAGGGTQVLARVDLLSSWLQQQIAAHGGSGTSTSGTSGGTAGGASGGSSGSSGSSGGTSGTSACAASEKEPNDAYTAPSALATGATCGALATASDVDWFGWSVPAAGVVYDLKLKATGDATAKMWKASATGYTEVAASSSNEFNKTSSGAGSYVVAVWSPSGQTQTYTVSLAR